MRVDRAREAALDALAACRRNGAWIDGALKQVLKRDGLSGRDAAFASRIAYGVMQSRIYLDRCLARCLTQRPEKLEPLLLDILRIGAYQILFMDKVPVNAAVNEAVEMAKAHKLSRAAGLVNAVLRNVDRRRGEPLAFADELEALSVQTSHPRALVERMVGLLGAEEAEAFLRADNEPVPTTIQTNTLKTTAKQLRASLEDESVTVEPHPWLADCFTVSGTGDLEGLRAWREGWFTVQDAAAKLTALAAAPKAGSFVIDTCAAPGGKSFAMAMCMEGKGHILSCDVEETSCGSWRPVRSGWGSSAWRSAWPMAVSAIKRLRRRRTSSSAMCRAPDSASSARSRISAIRTWLRSRVCPRSKAPFWTMPHAMSGAAGRSFTPPARCFPRKTSG